MLGAIRMIKVSSFPPNKSNSRNGFVVYGLGTEFRSTYHEDPGKRVETSASQLFNRGTFVGFYFLSDLLLR